MPVRKNQKTRKARATTKTGTTKRAARSARRSMRNAPPPVLRISPALAIPTLRRHMLVDGFDIVIDLEKSKGSYIVDARTGKR